MTTVRLEGLKGVMQTLRQLPPELVARRGGVIKTAIRKAALLIQEEAKNNVRRIVAEPNENGEPSRSTGALEQAISSRRIKPAGGAFGEAYIVYVAKLKKKFVESKGLHEHLPPSWYQWFLELGTERSRPHPFMRPAYDSKKGEALDLIVSEINAGIDKAIKKLKKRYGVKG